MVGCRQRVDVVDAAINFTPKILANERDMRQWTRFHGKGLLRLTNDLIMVTNEKRMMSHNVEGRILAMVCDGRFNLMLCRRSNPFNTE